MRSAALHVLAVCLVTAQKYPAGYGPRSIAFTHTAVVGTCVTSVTVDWNDPSTWDSASVPTSQSNVSVSGAGVVQHYVGQTYVMSVPDGSITVANFDCRNQMTLRSEGTTVITVDNYINLGHCYFEGITLVVKGEAFYENQNAFLFRNRQLHLRLRSKIILVDGSMFTVWLGASLCVEEDVFTQPDVGSIEVQSGGRINFYIYDTLSTSPSTIVEPWFELKEGGVLAVYYEPGTDACTTGVHFATGGHIAGIWEVGNTPKCAAVSFFGQYTFSSTHASGMVELGPFSPERLHMTFDKNIDNRLKKEWTTELTHVADFDFTFYSFSHLLTLMGPRQTFEGEVFFRYMKIRTPVECAESATCHVQGSIMDSAFVNKGTTIFTRSHNADAVTMVYDATFENYGIVRNTGCALMSRKDKWELVNHVSGRFVIEKFSTPTSVPYECEVKLVNEGIIEFAEPDGIQPYTKIAQEIMLGGGTIIMAPSTTWKVRMIYDTLGQKVVCDVLDFTQYLGGGCYLSGNVEVEIIRMSAIGGDDRDWTPAAGDSCVIAKLPPVVSQQNCSGQLNSVSVTGFDNAIITYRPSFVLSGPDILSYLSVELCSTNCDIKPPNLNGFPDADTSTVVTETTEAPVVTTGAAETTEAPVVTTGAAETTEAPVVTTGAAETTEAPGGISNAHSTHKTFAMFGVISFYLIFR